MDVVLRPADRAVTMARDDPQMMLPLDLRQPRSGREKASVYEAIGILRRLGHVVRRVGRQHSIDGRVFDSRQLVRISAERERAQPQPAADG